MTTPARISRQPMPELVALVRAIARADAEAAAELPRLAKVAASERQAAA